MRSILTLLLVLLIHVGFAQQLTSSNKKALKKYEKALESLRNRDDQGAIPDLLSAIEEDPGFIEPHIILGDVYSDMKDLEKGISYYETVASINPNFYPKVFYNLAQNYFLLEQYSDALQNIEEYLKNPKRERRLDVFAQSLQKNARFAAQAIKQPVAVNFENLGVNINTKFNEYYPCLTADDQTLLFTRRVPDDRVQTRVK